jgi:hypothetical protein
MTTMWKFALGVAGLSLVALPGSRADRATLDCPLRQIGLDYAQRVQPAWRPISAFSELADALNGAEEAVN